MFKGRFFRTRCTVLTERSVCVVHWRRSCSVIKMSWSESPRAWNHDIVEQVDNPEMARADIYKLTHHSHCLYYNWKEKLRLTDLLKTYNMNHEPLCVLRSTIPLFTASKMCLLRTEVNATFRFWPDVSVIAYSMLFSSRLSLCRTW